MKEVWGIMKIKGRDGALFGQIIRFSVPLMATALLQVLFNTADLAVVGQFSGSLATAAVGATSALINLIVSLFFGLASGVCVVAAQAYGAGDLKRVERASATALLVGLATGVVVGIAGFFCAGTLLEWMDTPAEVIEGAKRYMKIYFLGVPGMLVYNFCASIFRAVGDSKHPLYILAAAGAANVVLNIVFVAGFGMAEAGVALATSITQVWSAVMVVWMLCRKACPWRLTWKGLHIDRPTLRQIVRIGLPAGIQGSLFSVSNVVLQSAVNSLGAAAVSACAACNTIENYGFMMMSQFNQTAVTFVGQGVGARDAHKVRSTVRICLASVTAIGALVGTFIIVLRAPLLRIFVPDSPEAIAIGMERIVVMGYTYILCAYMDVFSGGLRGLGVSLQPMLITMIGIIGSRFFWVYAVFPTHRTLTELFVSYPVSWVLCVLAQLPLFLHCRKKLERSIALDAASTR